MWFRFYWNFSNTRLCIKMGGSVSLNFDYRYIDPNRISKKVLRFRKILKDNQFKEYAKEIWESEAERGRPKKTFVRVTLYTYKQYYYPYQVSCELKGIKKNQIGNN